MYGLRTRLAASAVALAALLAGVALVGGGGGAPAGAAATAGGPVLVLGIDAEDGGVGGHGPISVYDTMVNNLYANVSNGGSGILVLGGGKNAGDSVTEFWTQIGIDTGRPVTFANGAAVGTQSFAGFGVVAVASSESESNGGVVDSENDLLTGRADDVADHVNNGGGLIVLTQSGLANPYAFMATVGAIGSDHIVSGNDSDIDVNADGLAAGLSDELDVCCWHHAYTSYPSFLVPLATYAGSTEIAALGGASVIIGPPPTSTPFTLDPNVTTSTAAPTTSTVPDTTEPPSTVAPTEPPSVEGVEYDNCAEVRAAGKAPIREGQPGFGAHLDSDHDGIGCEALEATGARPIPGRPGYAG